MYVCVYIYLESSIKFSNRFDKDRKVRSSKRLCRSTKKF